jgi:hypothetical protein
MDVIFFKNNMAIAISSSMKSKSSRLISGRPTILPKRLGAVRNGSRMIVPGNEPSRGELGRMELKDDN